MKGMLQLLPRMGFDASLQKSLMTVLKPYLGEDVSIMFRGITTSQEFPFSKKADLEEIYVMIGMSPLPHKAFIKIDPLLAFVMIDKILGGNGDVQMERMTLTEAEQGVLSYLILKFLAHIYEHCGPENQVHFRFEGFCFRANEVKDLAPPDQALVFSHFEATVAGKTGIIQVILPDPFLTKAFLEPMASRAPMTTHKEEIQKRWKGMSHVQAPVWAEVGQVSLSPEELSQLDEGDVVLLDESTVTLEKGHVRGTATIRVGKGESVALESKVVDDGPVLKLQLD